MAELVADCPRCGASSVTFDVKASNQRPREYDWELCYELFAVCRHCHKATTFVVLSKGSTHTDRLNQYGGPEKYPGVVNDNVKVSGYINLRSQVTMQPPEHVPGDIAKAFSEAATCLAVECPNAAAAMFRLCVDLATKPLLPEKDEEGLNARVRRDLGLRLKFLFDTKRLHEALRELSGCIREDGNDGVHAGTLGNDDAADVQDFTVALLERLFTEQKRLELAKVRRDERRNPGKK